MNNNTNLLLEEEEANLSSFRRRNNIIILILTTFFVSVTVIIAALMFHIFHGDNVGTSEPSDPSSIPFDPAVQAFYSATACNTPSCTQTFTPIIIGPKSPITNPNQILDLSLQTAAEQLGDIASFLPKSIAFNNCSNSLRAGSNRIWEVLVTMRVNPFVETWSEEQRVEILNRIIGVERDLKTCLDDLGKVEDSTAVSEVMAKVQRVKVYVSSSGDFVVGYDKVLRDLWSENRSENIDSVWNVFLNVVFVCIGGVEWYFIFVMFRKVCRSR